MKEATGRAPLVGWCAQTLKREHMPAGLELHFIIPACQANMLLEAKSVA
jgi:hypothetical protein